MPPTRYTLLRQLADTNSGRVFLARRRNDHHHIDGRQQEVVIKQSHIVKDGKIPFNDSLNELSVASLLRSLPGHANVVQYHDVYVDNRYLNVVMEYCPRGDLFNYVKNQPDSRVPEHDALAICLQIAHGLAYLHDHGIAHRDLSLENILISGDERYKICDFGLSCPAEQESDEYVGKAIYMAPEVVNGGLYDPVKADIWSFGVMLFIMLTGSPFVQLASLSSAEYHAVNTIGCRGLLKHWKIDHLISFATMDLLSRMLQHDPANRFQDVDQLLNHPALLAAERREMG